MLRFLLLIALCIALILGIGYAYGSSLPREHEVTSRIELAQPVQEVWAVVRNPAALRGTWPELTRAERATDPSGRETWVTEVDGNTMRLQVTEAQAPRRMVTTIVAGDDAEFGGSWIYQLAPTPEGGTRVTLTEAGWVRNPLYRVMGRMFGMHHSIEGYLRALGTHFSEAVRPVRVT